MKKYSSFFSGIFVYLAFVLLVAGAQDGVSSFKSVEFGLAELSPNGRSGGYAVPASGGSSGASCSISLSPSSVERGGNTTVRVNWNKGQWDDANSLAVYRNGTEICSTSLGSGSSDTYSCSGRSTGLSAGDHEYKAVLVTASYEHEQLVCEGMSSECYRQPAKYVFGGASCTADLTVRNANSPTVTLYQTHRTNGAWSGWQTSNATINAGDPVYLRWVSANTTSCTATAGNGFGTGGATNGRDDDINEPAAGRSEDYSVRCVGPGGAATDSIRITARVSQQPPTATISQDKSTTVKGESFALTYGRGGGGTATSCRLEYRAPGGSWKLNASNSGGLTTLHPAPVAVGTWSWRTQCTGPGGTSAWVSLNHTVTNSPQPPTATISQSSASTQTGQAFTVTYGRSGGGTATSCTLQRRSPGGSFGNIHSNNGGTSVVNQTLSTSGTWSYRANCTGPGGTSAWVSLNHTVTFPSPTVTLRVRNTTDNTGWTPNNITIDVGDQIALNWTSTNASSCSGNNFSTGGAPNGTQNNVTEPTLGTSIAYTVQCTGLNGSSVNDVISVSAIGEPPTITTDDPIVKVGDETEIEWDTKDVPPEDCSVFGPGVDISPLTNPTGSETVTITAESTYVIDCGANGKDEVTIRVLPIIQET